MLRVEVLKTANDIVNGDREQSYGSPEDNFKKIADLWSVYWSKYSLAPFEAKDVAVMLILLKIARISSGNAKDDNWIDIAGYAACGGEIQSAMEVIQNGNADYIHERSKV